MVEEFNIMPFNFTELREISCVCGQKKRVNTMTAIRLAQMSPHVRLGQFLIIANSVKRKEAWKKFAHPTYINDPSLELLEEITKSQMDVTQEYKSAGKNVPPELHLTLIIDNCKEIMQSKEMEHFLLRARHLKIDIIFTMKDENLQLIRPRIRQQITNYFVTSKIDDISKMLQFIEDKEIKKQIKFIIDGFFQNRAVLILNCCSNPKTILNTCFYFNK